MLVKTRTAFALALILMLTATGATWVTPVEALVLAEEYHEIDPDPKNAIAGDTVSSPLEAA